MLQCGQFFKTITNAGLFFQNKLYTIYLLSVEIIPTSCILFGIKAWNFVGRVRLTLQH